MVREKVLEPLIAATIAQLVLPEDWRDIVQQLLNVDDKAERSAVEKRKQELHYELRRLSFQHQKNLITDDDYVRLATPAKNELEQFVRQTVARIPEHVTMAGEQMIAIQSSWVKATKEQKQAMLRLLFRAVYVDTNRGEIVSYEPHPEFDLLFGQTSMTKVEGRYVPAPL